MDADLLGVGCRDFEPLSAANHRLVIAEIERNRACSRQRTREFMTSERLKHAPLILHRCTRTIWSRDLMSAKSGNKEVQTSSDATECSFCGLIV